MSRLATWYGEAGRHDLPWRHTRDRWAVLVSEVMLQQTQVGRVLGTWPQFMDRFPTPQAAAAAGPGELIRAWGRLGYPRRARRLWEAATRIAAEGWPDDLTALPGVGRYTAGAVVAQSDDADVPAVDANIRRVVQRVAGAVVGERSAEALSVEVGAPLRGRDRLLALMDVGALVCTARAPRCDVCPIDERCVTRGELAGERRTSASPFAGSFRQRRGALMAVLRSQPARITDLDFEVLSSLVDDGLAVIDGEVARLP